MVMGGFGIEMVGIALQIILSFVGLLLLSGLAIARKGVEAWSKTLFFLYSLCCFAQVSLMLRAVIQSFHRSLGADLPFLLWSVYGSICFVLGVALLVREINGKHVAQKLYTIAFLAFAIIPWGRAVLGRAVEALRGVASDRDASSTLICEAGARDSK
ncbi:hypothetical protein [Lysobacter arvi]|uniref:Uncharacterized protein n=1 Tax=Lysobacter arvi TaxID=3038776 RepID=A0ABU1CE57_9GAMM|nr:hypothetical protein [Lysobacter arvi]MDR0183481.1 hypothetical protein [Lysobacter arvi]